MATLSMDALATHGLNAAEHIFSALDANHDGNLSLDELKHYLMSRDAWCTKEDVTALFKQLDRNKDKKVTLDELKAGFAAMKKPPILWLMALRPPPAGSAVFADLVRAGGPMNIPKVEERAISLRQLKALMAHVQRRCEKEGWLGKRFQGGMHYEQLTPEGVNLYDAATHVILPATYHHRLPGSRNTQPSYVEMVAKQHCLSQRPDYFASHFWGEPVQDFINCVAQHTRDREYGGGKCDDHQRPGADGDDALIWVCAYANRQWSLSSALTDDPKQTSFHRAISISKGTLAIVDSGALYFTRIWCDYEIHTSLTMDEEGRASRYTYDVYTAAPNDDAPITTVDGAPTRRSKPLAVGLVDGLCPADESYGGMHTALAKSLREQPFPASLQLRGMTARLQMGDASVEEDKKHILNSIARRPLNDAYVKENPYYEEVNDVLHGNVAAGSIRLAIVEGGRMLDVTLEALRRSSVKRVGVFLQDCDQATSSVLERVFEALPATLLELSVMNSKHLDAAPVAAFKKLRTLCLCGCESLVSVGGLAGRSRTLHRLDLSHCPRLERVPGLAALTELIELNLCGCMRLAALPDLGLLTSVKDVNLGGCARLASLPSLEKLCNLQRLDLSNCLKLSRTPDLPPQVTMHMTGVATAVDDSLPPMKAQPAMPARLPNDVYINKTPSELPFDFYVVEQRRVNAPMVVHDAFASTMPSQVVSSGTGRATGRARLLNEKLADAKERSPEFTRGRNKLFSNSGHGMTGAYMTNRWDENPAPFQSRDGTSGWRGVDERPSESRRAPPAHLLR